MASDNKPDWVDKPHFKDASHSYFVGMSTQNSKLEDGRQLATEEAKKSAADSIGELLQSKYQSIMGLRPEDSVVHDALGNLHAPTFLKSREVEGWYHEKWVSYSKCVPTYHYNVWVLMKIPQSELDAEQAKAVAYLENAQQQFMAQHPERLLSDGQLSKADLPQNKLRAQKSITQQPLPTEHEETFTPPVKKKTGFWAGLGAILIVGGLGVGTYFLATMGKKSSSTGVASGASSGASGGGSGGGVSINVPLP